MSQKLTKNQRRAVIAACAAALVAMDNGLGNTIFAYIKESYPAVSPNALVLFLSIGHVVGMIGAFLVGPLSMRYSKKWLMVVAITFMAFVGCVYVTAGGNCPYWVMILCSGLDGLESSIISCIPATVIAMSVNSPEQCVKYTGYEQAAVMLGSLFFSLLGGQIGAIKWQYAYYLYLISIPILIFLVFWMPDDAKWAEKDTIPEKVLHNSHGKVKRTLRAKTFNWSALRGIHPIMLFVLLQYFLFYACSFTFKSTVSEYVILQYQLGSSVEAGFINALMTCMGMITGLVFGHIASVFRRWLVPVLALAMMLGFLSMYLFTASLAGCVIAALLIGFAKSGMMPAVIGQARKFLPRELTPMFVSFLVGFMNLGMSVSHYIISPISNAIGGETIPAKLLVTVAFCAAAGLIAVAVYIPRRGTHKAHRHASHSHAH